MCSHTHPLYTIVVPMHPSMLVHILPFVNILNMHKYSSSHLHVPHKKLYAILRNMAFIDLSLILYLSQYTVIDGRLLICIPLLLSTYIKKSTFHHLHHHLYLIHHCYITLLPSDCQEGGRDHPSGGAAGGRQVSGSSGEGQQAAGNSGSPPPAATTQ